ncbi:(RS)-norcoclaurine 6-O-methyltransferase [Apostasia shenzhenica]|uniref:(RS)-norcoclaurine 6-O-methyltransferase n=1 Tax=Apostasia shenzhenica TaxID=1088818 RepID=A0A2H9ZXL5_9ASPA|nr:(RS)-norcoclaurine 6-O-methyltransferase [Apostasia shenzhenica]
MARVEETAGVSAGEDDLHCQVLVLKCMAGVMDTMVLKCAVKLQIFDAIHRHSDRPISLPELAASLRAPHVYVSALRRVMRYLANMRLIDLQHLDTNGRNGEGAGEHYSLSPAAATYLRVESERSFVPLFMHYEEIMAPFHALDACVTSDRGPDVVASELLGRESFYAMLARDPEVGKSFDSTMTATVMRMAESVVDGCPAVFEGVGTLVDVGGGEGLMAAAIARAFPAVKCVVLDLPQVVEKAPERNGVEFVAGDMFVSLPQADAMLFTRILHNWSDNKVLEILKRCKEAFDGHNGKVIIVDIVIKDVEDNENMQSVKLFYDMMMMVNFGGKERTESEWRSILLKAGFTNCKFTPLMTLEHVIVARP